MLIFLYRFCSCKLQAFRMSYTVYPDNYNGVVSQIGTSPFSDTRGGNQTAIQPYTNTSNPGGREATLSAKAGWKP